MRSPGPPSIRPALDVEGAPAPATGKVQQKPLLLLKALIAHGGRDVAAARLSDALWPGAAGDAAAQALATTLHRLRALLRDEQALELYRGPLLGHRDLEGWGLSARQRLRAAFERCRRALAAGLAVAPSAATEALRLRVAAAARPGAPR